MDGLSPSPKASRGPASSGRGSCTPTERSSRPCAGFPTLWRLATEYFFLRWLAPRSRLLNAFYGAGFDHGTRRDAEFLVGAVLLVRRETLDEVGGFDERFFMFNEEVDLCYRVRAPGGALSSGPGRSSCTSAELRRRGSGHRCTGSSFARTSAS